MAMKGFIPILGMSLWGCGGDDGTTTAKPSPPATQAPPWGGSTCYAKFETINTLSVESYSECVLLQHNDGLFAQCLKCHVDAAMLDFCNSGCTEVCNQYETFGCPDANTCQEMDIAAAKDYQEGGCLNYVRANAEACVFKDSAVLYNFAINTLGCEAGPVDSFCELCMMEVAITDFCGAGCNAMHTSTLTPVDCAEFMTEYSDPATCDAFVPVPTPAYPSVECVAADVAAKDDFLRAVTECAPNDFRCAQCSSISMVKPVCDLNCSYSLTLASSWGGNCTKLLEDNDIEFTSAGCKNYPETFPPGSASPTAECLLFNSQTHQEELAALSACEPRSGAHPPAGSDDRFEECVVCSVANSTAVANYCASVCYTQFIQGGLPQDACIENADTLSVFCANFTAP